MVRSTRIGVLAALAFSSLMGAASSAEAYDYTWTDLGKPSTFTPHRIAVSTDSFYNVDTIYAMTDQGALYRYDVPNLAGWVPVGTYANLKEIEIGANASYGLPAGPLTGVFDDGTTRTVKQMKYNPGGCGVFGCVQPSYSWVTVSSSLPSGFNDFSIFFPDTDPVSYYAIANNNELHRKINTGGWTREATLSTRLARITGIGTGNIPALVESPSGSDNGLREISHSGTSWYVSTVTQYGSRPTRIIDIGADQQSRFVYAIGDNGNIYRGQLGLP